MILFAQIADIAPDWLKNMAIFIACTSATAFYIKGLLNGKQKREVSFSEEATSKREFEAHATACLSDRAALRQELRTNQHENEVHASERSKTIYTKMESVRLELKSDTEQVRRELSVKIDDMPDRIIATLRNTGALKP